MLIAAAVGLDDGVVERRDRIAFTGDFRGDALKDFRGQARIDENGQFRLAEHVDEAGGDDFAGGVDGALARSCGEIADGGDFAVADADVSGIPGRTGAVDDVAVGDDEVEGLGACALSRQDWWECTCTPCISASTNWHSLNFFLMISSP